MNCGIEEETSRESNYGIAYLLFAFASAGVLFAIILQSPAQYVFDEKFYMPHSQKLLDSGLTLEFIREAEITTGPLHAIVQSPILLFTRNHFIAPRILSCVLFGLLIFTTYFLSSQYTGAKSVLPAISLLAVPVMWQFAGLAITEMPAFVALQIGILLLFASAKSTQRLSLLIAAASGLCIGIACSGRQTFVVALPFLTIVCSALNKNYIHATAFLIFASIIPIGLFVLWGGLLPPSSQTVWTGLRLESGVASYAHLGLFIFFIAPTYLILPKWHYLAIGMIALIASIFGSFVGFVPLTFTPAKRIVQQLFSEKGTYLYFSVCNTAFWFFCIFTLYVMLHDCWKRRNDMIAFSLLLCTLALALTPIKMSFQYSDRYTAIAIPTLICVVSRHIKSSWFHLSFCVLGATWGALTLLQYYRF